jgi:hypothetical protein
VRVRVLAIEEELPASGFFIGGEGVFIPGEDRGCGEGEEKEETGFHRDGKG